MSIDVEIEPDGTRPLGGYARILLPAGTLAGPTTSVSLYEMFRERFLGEDGWQPTEALFGPYPVEDLGDRQCVIVGPEIVNHIDEFAAVRLALGDVVSETTWPDAIAHAPTAPPLGRILRPDEPDPAAGSALTGTRPTPAPTPQPEPPQEVAEPDPPAVDPVVEPVAEPIDDPVEPEPDPVDPPTDPVPVKSGSSSWIWIVLVLLLAAAAGGAYYHFAMREPVPAPEPEPVPDPVPEPVPEPEPAPDPCTDAALSADDVAFADRLAALRACGDKASAAAALAVLEAGLAAEDAETLLTFGHLYNPDISAPGIEDLVGLSFDPQPEVAIDYYMRARDAGAEGADAALSASCDALRASDPSAAEDLCE
ncbi:MAG: hypothetical protein OIF47_05060 [Marinibacterium sp.]|nr:hypothetical protein [Marinibacterium sp.]